MEQPNDKALRILKELGKSALGFGKAQLILFGVNFTVITIGMLIAGMGLWSPLIALGVSILDLLPVIGSGVVFVPWCIIALICKSHAMALAVGITYIVMVVLRMVLDPIITGKNVGLSPLVTLLASIGGLIVFGGVGAIIGPIIASVASILYRLLREKPSAAPSQDATPQSTVPQSTAPQDTVPQDTAPQSTAPQDTAPQSTAPQDTVPQDTAPKDPMQ